MFPAHLLTGLLAVLTLFVVAPQAVRCWRLRTTDGISGFSQSLCLAAAAAWFTYGVLERDAAQLLTNAIDGALTVGVLVAMCRYGGMSFRAAFCRVIAVFFAVSTLAVLAGSSLVLALAVVLVSVWHVPQMWLAWKRPGGLGLSLVSLFLSTTLNIAWFTYGIVIGDHAVSASAAWTSFAALFVAVRTLVGRRQVAGANLRLQPLAA